jgi:hypothetical protein
MTEYSTSDNLFQGVVQGCLFGQNDRVDDLNDRMYGRYFPDNALRPNYDPRPVPTKYMKFPIINPEYKVRIQEPLKEYYPLNNTTLGETKTPFFSGSNNVPIMRNIDLETNLRNQSNALQRGAHQGTFVPSSKSDLYKVEISNSSNMGEQPFPELFQNYTYSTRPLNIDIGNAPLYNHTRTQLRNLSR